MPETLYNWLIYRMKNHLEPLAIAANATQSAFCRLDEVLLTLGTLYMGYSTLDDPQDRTARNAILASIDQRWKKSDQEVFIAAVVLNPYIKTAPFRQLPFLTNAGLLALFKRLWLRFFTTEAPLELHRNLQNYMNSSGAFQDLSSYAETLEQEAKFKVHFSCCLSLFRFIKLVSQNETPNPIHVYEGLSHPGQEPLPLVKLALHVLAICANSASCERLFSVFGQILTNLRSRLGTAPLTDLAELKMHLRDEHVRNGTKQHLKRSFGGERDSDLCAQQSTMAASGA